MGNANQTPETLFSDPTTKPTFNKNLLRVATLNYCGVAYSPFEFYFHDHQKQLEEISGIFRRLLSVYIPNFNDKTWKWEMGKIDKTFKKYRYSSMFYQEVGHQFIHFLNKKQFEEKWEIEFSKNAPTFKFEWTKEQKETVRLYDFIMYHTLLAFVYKTQNFEQAIKNDPKKYRDTLKPFYQISFLNEQTKIEKFMESFVKLKVDILFIQEYSSVLLAELSKNKDLYIEKDPREDSLVVLNRNHFKVIDNCEKAKKIINEEQEKYFRWAQSVVLLRADNYLIVCAHLSSKQDKNKTQVQNLRKDLSLLRKNLPKYEIIVGGDLNSYVEQIETFNSFPNSAKEFTTLKKRTSTQAQFNKAEKQVKESKDKIFTTLKISHGSVSFFNGQKADDKSFIPSHDHPFDHFLVLTELHV